MVDNVYINYVYIYIQIYIYTYIFSPSCYGTPGHIRPIGRGIRSWGDHHRAPVIHLGWGGGLGPKLAVATNRPACKCPRPATAEQKMVVLRTEVTQPKKWVTSVQTPRIQSMDYLHASERPTKLFAVRPEKEKHDLRGFAGALPKRSKQYMIYSSENAHRILG